MSDKKSSGEIQNVSDTAIWVAYYRARESERADALFRDPFAKRLIGERGKAIAESMGVMGKYTEWSVVSRTVMIDQFIQEAIRGGVTTILNLGAGLDTRPYRMSLPSTLRWIEVDQAQIIEMKNSELSAEVPICRLERVTADLSKVEIRREIFNQLGDQKVLVLTEGVVPYLTPENVAALGRELHDCRAVQSWVTEYFDPAVYKYLKARFRTNKMKRAPFLFFPADFLGFFRNIGWVPAEIRYASDVAKQSGRKVPMPWFAFLFRLFSSRAAREKSGRLSGYMILKRA